MYCTGPASKKQKMDCDNELSETFTQYTEKQHNIALTDNEITNQFSTQKERSPILENKERSFRKCLKTSSYSVLKKLSRFPRTVLDGNVVESKFFSNNEDIQTNDNTSETSENNISNNSIIIDESPERKSRNPFKKITTPKVTMDNTELECIEEPLENSQKENSPYNSPVKHHSPILEPSPRSRNPFRAKIDVQIIDDNMDSEKSVIENTYPMETLITPTASQVSGIDKIQPLI